jgi:drug/metabolite transporter (DMT)-like permease
MHWLYYVFFSLILVLGAAVFVVLMRISNRRAWIWALVSLVGALGLLALVTGNYRAGWRGIAMGAVFDLFAADHFVQYVQSRRAGTPKKIMLALAGIWLLLGLLQAFTAGDATS